MLDAQIEVTAALANEIWHEFFPAILSAEQIDYMVEKFQSVRAMKEQIGSEGYKYFLLFRGRERVGYIAVRQAPPQYTAAQKQPHVRRLLKLFLSYAVLSLLSVNG